MGDAQMIYTLYYGKHWAGTVRDIREIRELLLPYHDRHGCLSYGRPFVLPEWLK
jgi:hypothetical protein